MEWNWPPSILDETEYYTTNSINWQKTTTQRSTPDTCPATTGRRRTPERMTHWPPSLHALQDESKLCLWQDHLTWVTLLTPITPCGYHTQKRTTHSTNTTHVLHAAQILHVFWIHHRYHTCTAYSTETTHILHIVHILQIVHIYCTRYNYYTYTTYSTDTTHILQTLTYILHIERKP